MRLVIVRVLFVVLVVLSIQPFLENERIPVLEKVIGLPWIIRKRRNERLLLRLHERNVVLIVGSAVRTLGVVDRPLAIVVHRASSSSLSRGVELIVWIRGIIRERESREVVELLRRVIGKRKRLLLFLTETDIISLRINSGLGKGHSGCKCK